VLQIRTSYLSTDLLLKRADFYPASLLIQFTRSPIPC